MEDGDGDGENSENIGQKARDYPARVRMGLSSLSSLHTSVSSL